MRHLFLVVAASFLVFFTSDFVGAQKKKVDPAAPPPTRETLLKDVKPAEGFTASIFASPPDVSYPTCLCAAPNGDVYVGIDLNGSLGTRKGQGKIVRCIDTDNDGHADQFKVFCEVQHPRGLFYDHGKMIVLHPPSLTAYYDDDGDGVADRSEVLLKGITTDATYQRGADHTTNGFRVGIDGWLYIAVGDFGFLGAEGKDGKKVQLYGGGVARVRPDGTDLEIVSHGQRNIYDVAVSPTLDLFTRDNTNDGGGWDVRLSHVVPLGQYGYPSLYKNFPDEHLHPLADFGGGSPCGALYLSEPGFPAGFGDALYSVEWGRSAIFRHPLKAEGAGYAKATQSPLVNLPAPTDMDVDGSGRLYITSWRGGGFNFSHPNVGFVARVVPKNWKYEPFADVTKADDAGLLKSLTSPSHVRRLTTQLEILRRGAKPDLVKGLETLLDSKESLPVRVAALFTYKQLLGAKAVPAILASAKADDLREFAIRAAADRVGEDKGVPTEWLTKFLTDPNPRVVLQATIALGRLGRVESAAALLPLTSATDPTVRHIAGRALVLLKPADVCLKAVAAQQHVPGSLRVLQTMHDPKVVASLIELYQRNDVAERQQALLTALCRLYFQEGTWDGKWWGTRPDTTGPYFRRVTWSESDKIGGVLKQALTSVDSTTLRSLLIEIRKHKIEIPEATAALLRLANDDAAFRQQALDLLLGSTAVPDEALPLLTNAAAKDVPAQRAKALRGLHRFMNQKGFLDAALTSFAQLTLKDRANKDLGSAWEDFTRDGKLGGNLPLIAKLTEAADPAARDLGWAVLVNLATGKLTAAEPRAAAQKRIDMAWAKPETLVPLLHAIGQTRADQYAFQLRGLLKNDNPAVQKAALETWKILGLDRDNTGGKRIVLKGQPYDQVLAEAQKPGGDAKLGSLLFLKQGCIACHTVSPTEPLKGPYLGDIAARSKRPELIESLLKPSAKIAQGFETIFFVLNDGKIVEGFIVRESGDEVELRTNAGISLTLAKKNIDERGRRPISVMPEGIIENLTATELSSLLAYMESLNTKK